MYYIDQNGYRTKCRAELAQAEGGDSDYCEGSFRKPHQARRIRINPKPGKGIARASIE